MQIKYWTVSAPNTYKYKLRDQSVKLLTPLKMGLYSFKITKMASEGEGEAINLPGGLFPNNNYV